METNIRSLIEQIGCEESEARLALELCDYDAEKALGQFNNLVQDLTIIKARIKSPSAGIFALFMIILNPKEKRVIRLSAVVCNNPAICETNLDGNWFVFDRKIYTIRLGEGSLQSSTQELESHLFQNLQYEKSKNLYELLRHRKDAAVSEFIEKLVSQIRFFSDSLELNLLIDYIGQKTKKRQQMSLSKESAAMSLRQEKTNIDLAITLVKGKVQNSVPAKFLLNGDMVMTEVVDERDVASYICRLFGGVKQEKDVPLHAVVEDIVAGKNYLTVKVRFSPGITGFAYVLPEDDIIVIENRSVMPARRLRKFFVDIKKKFDYNI
ncbi:MAG: hypothetical protein ABH857_00230 [Elusimicrobiota bacterium]